MKNSTTITMAALALCGLFGPMPAQAHVTTDGYLKVFSATQEVQWGEGSYYYPRTGYLVYGTDGSVVKQVENQASLTSSEPEQVELAPGTYTVRAQSDAGYVSRRVTIKPSQLTEVRL
jgi:hypothetical protein